MKGRWPITMMCEVLEDSPSGCFSWSAADVPGRPGRFHSNEALLAQMKAIHVKIGDEYGWPRMHKVRVRQLVQRHGIGAKGKRKCVVTTGSAHPLPVSPDLVQTQFKPVDPNQLWSGDITYLPTDEGWLYLAVVPRLHSRQIVGWSVQPHMRASKDALWMACFCDIKRSGDIVLAFAGCRTGTF